MLEPLLERFRHGDRLALARLLTHISRGEHLEEIHANLAHSQRQPARVVAITGSGGVGKSTLTGKLIRLLRDQGKTVAVLACDPQSPLTGGALLGDRFRMPAEPEDGVYIRSLAAAAGQGSIARHLGLMVRLLEAYGFDVILIETVGAGQGDTAVRELADVVVLLLQPETGDDLQWEKAGLLEVADIVVIHKADLPGADRVEAQVRAALEIGGQEVAVLRVSAKSGEGLKELWKVVEASALRHPSVAMDGQELLRLAQENLASRFASAEQSHDVELSQIIARRREGLLKDDEAAGLVLHHLATK